MIKISGKVDKSNGFTGNTLFFIHRTSSDQTSFVFFYILEIEEIDEIKEKNKDIKANKGSKDKGHISEE